MKTELSTIALLLCVAALATVAVTGVMYVQQQSAQESITSELGLARDALAEYEGNVTRLEAQMESAEAWLAEEQLANAEARLAVEQAYSPDMIGGGGVLNAVFRLAEESGLNVVSVTTQPEGDETIYGDTYLTLSVDLQVTGGLDKVASFLEQLGRGAIMAITIDHIAIEGIEDWYAASVYFSARYPRFEPT